jgi:hypothetical protein
LGAAGLEALILHGRRQGGRTMMTHRCQLRLLFVDDRRLGLACQWRLAVVLT